MRIRNATQKIDNTIFAVAIVFPLCKLGIGFWISDNLKSRKAIIDFHLRKKGFLIRFLGITLQFKKV